MADAQISSKKHAYANHDLCIIVIYPASYTHLLSRLMSLCQQSDKKKHIYNNNVQQMMMSYRNVPFAHKA